MNISMHKAGSVGGFILLLLCLSASVPPAADATFPGRPGVIVFNMITFQGDGGDYTGGLYALRPGQENPRQLTTNPWDYDPSFAPSGKELVFRRTNTPRPGIYTLNLRSGNAKRLTTAGGDLDPAFGPDGMVVFSRFVQKSGYDLFLRAPDGRLRRLTSDNGSDGEAVFTPDGKRIVFSRSYVQPELLARAAAAPTDGLYSIRIDGTGLRRIGGLLSASSFDISPDGRYLVYDVLGKVTENSVETRVWRKQLSGGGRRLVSADASSPTYSPDGRKIAYSNYDGLWMRRADGRGGRTLVLKTEYAPFEAGAQLIVQPAWQPLP